MAANTQNFRVKYGLNVNSEATIGSNLTVNSVATFSNNVTIAGDLQVDGIVRFADELNLGTSQILMLKDETGSPSTNAFITVNRGTSTDVSIKWDETNDRWEFTNDGSNYFPLHNFSDLTYVYSNNTTTSTDPGAGTFRLNSDTLSTVTQIAVDNNELGGANVAPYIATFDDTIGTSTLLLRSAANPGRFAVYNVSAASAQTGFYQLTVAHVGGSTLFTNNDKVFIALYRGGDKGQKGERVTSGTYNSANDTVTYTNSDSSTFNITGFKGQKGEKGERVSSGSFTDANNTTTFTNSDSSTFLVTGLKGQKGQKGEVGDKGQKGEKISSTSYNDGTNTLTFTYSDGTTTSVTGVKGQKGDQGNSVKGEPGAAGGFTTDSNARVNSLGVGTSASATGGRIDCTTIYATSFLYTSDINYKYDVNSIQASLEFIKKLNPVTFKFINSNEPDGGFIAQDILEVIPDAVTDDGKKLSLKYNIIIAHLTKAVQELTEKVERLESKA